MAPGPPGGPPAKGERELFFFFGSRLPRLQEPGADTSAWSVGLETPVRECKFWNAAVDPAHAPPRPPPGQRHLEAAGWRRAGPGRAGLKLRGGEERVFWGGGLAGCKNGICMNAAVQPTPRPYSRPRPPWAFRVVPGRITQPTRSRAAFRTIRAFPAAGCSSRAGRTGSVGFGGGAGEMNERGLGGAPGTVCGHLPRGAAPAALQLSQVAELDAELDGDLPRPRSWRPALRGAPSPPRASRWAGGGTGRRKLSL